MFELTRECDRHPNTFMNLSPKGFRRNFKSWSDSYRKEVFEELSNEYKLHFLGDFSDGRTQLAQGLDSLSTACYLVSREMGDFEKRDNDFFGFSAEDFSRSFGFTSYFYQRECFKSIQKEMPRSFDSVLKSIDLVCKACRPHMRNILE